MSDPNRNPHRIARQLRRYIEHTPRGATISIMLFFISSSITWPALRAAYRRGVNIRAVLYGGPDGRPLAGVSWEGVKLTEMIRRGRANGRRGSWVVWTRKTGRGKRHREVDHALEGLPVLQRPTRGRLLEDRAQEPPLCLHPQGNGGGGSQSDQVTIGLYSEWAYNRLNRLLGPQIAHEPDNLAACDPIPDRTRAALLLS